MAIYTIPELSYAGKAERQLQAEKTDYVVGRGYYREIARVQIIGDETGLLKMLVDRHSQHIMGVHIVSESASELLHIGQLTMNMGGTVNDLVDKVFNDPTLAEGYKMAVMECPGQLAG